MQLSSPGLESLSLKVKGKKDQADTKSKWTTATTTHISKFNCKAVFSIEIEHRNVNPHYSLDLDQKAIKNCQAKSPLPKSQVLSLKLFIREEFKKKRLKRVTSYKKVG